MSLFTALRGVQRRVGIERTTAIVANADENQALLLDLANTSAVEIVRRKVWPQLREERTFLSSAAALQAGALPDDYDRIVKGTFWNRTMRRQLHGPVSGEQWQAFNSYGGSSSNRQYFRIMRSGIYIWPTPTAGETMAFDFVSNSPIQATGGGVYKTEFDADTDVYLFGDQTLKLDVIWRWKQSKGLEYAEDLKTFEIWLASEFNAGEGGVDVALSGFDDDFDQFAVNFPEGDFQGT